MEARPSHIPQRTRRADLRGVGCHPRVTARDHQTFRAVQPIQSFSREGFAFYGCASAIHEQTDFVSIAEAVVGDAARGTRARPCRNWSPRCPWSHTELRFSAHGGAQIQHILGCAAALGVCSCEVSPLCQHGALPEVLLVPVQAFDLPAGREGNVGALG